MTFSRLGRIALALPSAALVPACAFTMFSGSFPLGLIAFMYAAFFGLFIGVPFLIIYQFRRVVTPISVAIAGFLAGTIPFGFTSWPVSLAMKTTTVIDGTATVINGVPTLAGWLQFFEGLALFGGLGILGGLAFFGVLKMLGDPLTPGLSNSSEEQISVQSRT